MLLHVYQNVKLIVNTIAELYKIVSLYNTMQSLRALEIGSIPTCECSQAMQIVYYISTFVFVDGHSRFVFYLTKYFCEIYQSAKLASHGDWVISLPTVARGLCNCILDCILNMI